MSHRGRARIAFGAAAAVVVVSLTLGGLAASRPVLAVASGLAIVAVALAVTSTVPLLLVAFPAVFVAHRVGPAGLDMSVADLTLVAASIAALPFVPWGNPTVRRICGAVVAYQLLLLVTVVAQPTGRAAFEWAHRGVFLLGGLAVGAAAARLGAGRAAVRAVYAAAAVIAVVSVGQGLATGLRPAYPFGLQKNFAGGLLAMTILLAWVAPTYAGLSRKTTALLQAVFITGLLFTQSRGAMAALVVAMALWALLTRKRALRFLVLVPIAAVMVVLVVASLRAELQRTNDPYSPLSSRRIANQVALSVWRDNRVYGAGLRYFKAPGYRFDVPGYRTTALETHNVWYSTLAETGLVGLAALAVLIGLCLRALRRASGPLTLAAILILVLRLAHGMADIYWAAGIQTLPWLVVGLAAGSAGIAGAVARDRSYEPVPSHA